jgi:hypothetical protein
MLTHHNLKLHGMLARRHVTKDLVARLRAALEADSAAVASDYLLEIVRGAAESAAAEVACAERLRTSTGSNSSHNDSQEALTHLKASIAQASKFPRLKVGPIGFPEPR